MKERLIVDEGVAGERLDRFLAGKEAQVSRSHIQKLIESGCVLVNGRTAKANAKLREGDAVETEIPEAQELEILPEAIPLDILYEDSDVIVINKARGMVVHPAAGAADGTLVNALLHHCEDLSGINGVIRPGIVHRLDKDTSGVMVAAKNDRAHVDLAEQIREKTAQRIYRAIVCGTIAEARGEIRAPIGRHPTERKKMAVVPGGKEAPTLFRVVERFPAHTLGECRLKTGRTHQIRVHMAYIGHPLLGDPKYGRKTLEIAGQALHSCELSFTHPRTKERMTFAAEMPEDMKAILHALRRGR